MNDKSKATDEDLGEAAENSTEPGVSDEQISVDDALAEAEATAEKNWDLYLRAAAEVENLRKRATLNCMRWMKNSNVKQFFFASSSEVYGFPKVFPTSETEPLVIPDPLNPRFSYSSSKIVGETISINFGRSLGIDFTIARFHNIYGPHMGFEHVIPEFIRKVIRNEEFIVQGNGKESRSFCYIDDAISAILITCEKNEGRNEIFNIGTNWETTINELICKIQDVSGKKISPHYKNFPNSGTNRRLPDISKIKKIGYTPHVKIEEGLKKTFDWYQDYYINN